MPDREAQIPLEEFRLLADNMPVMCWIADATGYIHWYTSLTPEPENPLG